MLQYTLANPTLAGSTRGFVTIDPERQGVPYAVRPGIGNRKPVSAADAGVRFAHRQPTPGTCTLFTADRRLAVSAANPSC